MTDQPNPAASNEEVDRIRSRFGPGRTCEITLGEFERVLRRAGRRLEILCEASRLLHFGLTMDREADDPIRQALTVIDDEIERQAK